MTYSFRASNKQHSMPAPIWYQDLIINDLKSTSWIVLKDMYLLTKSEVCMGTPQNETLLYRPSDRVKSTQQGRGLRFSCQDQMSRLKSRLLYGFLIGFCRFVISLQALWKNNALNYQSAGHVSYWLHTQVMHYIWILKEIMNNTFLFSSCCACRILAFSSKCLAKNSSVCKQGRKFMQSVHRLWEAQWPHG